MPVSRPIVFVEDDNDDRELFAEALNELGYHNRSKFLQNGIEALEYLKTTKEQPHVIFCDINMPGLNGVELRNEINNSEYLRQKSIPFVFFTTTIDQSIVDEAFALSVQGFFKKPDRFSETKLIIKQVIDYWNGSKHPNSVN